MLCRIVLMALLTFVSALAAGEAPAAGGDEGWGEARDGLVCRIVVKPEFCLGEPVTVAVEFKNVSGKERTLLEFVSVLDPKIARLDITGPDGAPIKQHQTHGHGAFGPSAFKPLAPGAVRQIEFPDIRFWYGGWKDGFADGMRTPGEYTLTYTNMGAVPEQVIVATRSTPDGPVTQYDTPTKEEIAKAWSQGVVSKAVKFKVRAPTEKDFSVHEWGVFSIHTGVKMANAALKAEWATLPDFFYRQFPAQRLHWSPAQWDKPIIYFYTPLANLSIDVKVAFATGAPVVWWPACRKPVCNGDSPRAPMPAFNALEWAGWLGERLPASELPKTGARLVPVIPDLTPPEMPESCWLNDARNVAGAALFSVMGTPLNMGKPWGQRESERFIYYDGVMDAPDFLTCTAAQPNLVLKNNATFALKDLFVVDRRNVPEKHLGFAHIKELGAGQETTVQFTVVAAQDWPALGSKAVDAALTGAGLTASEAQSVLKIWREGFFGAPGVTAFYLLPQSEYDRMLPLQITPAPGKLVRVGIALHRGIDGAPALTETVRALIKDLDADEFEPREAAIKALAQHGGVAIRELRKTLASTKSVEVRENCRRVLNEIDASMYLEKK